MATCSDRAVNISAAGLWSQPGKHFIVKNWDV
jgi:hypothetical protein